MRGLLEHPWVIVAVGGLVVLTVYVRQSTKAVARRTRLRSPAPARVVVHLTRPCPRCGAPVAVTETFRPGRSPADGRPGRRRVGRCWRCERARGARGPGRPG